MLEGHGVVVREDRIAAVLPVAELPPDSRRLDFPGGTILPGFIDTHVHLHWHFGEDGRYTRDDPPEVNALHALENSIRMLEAGFTTVQSLGAAVDGLVRDAVNRGIVPGPRIITSLGSLNARNRRSGRNGGRGASPRRRRGGRHQDLRLGKQPGRRRADALPGTARRCVRRGERARPADPRARPRPVSATRAANAGCTTIEHGSLLDQATLDVLAEKGLFYDPNTYLIVANYLENKDRYLGIGNYTEEGFRLMSENSEGRMGIFGKALATEGLRVVSVPTRSRGPTARTSGKRWRGWSRAGRTRPT